MADAGELKRAFSKDRLLALAEREGLPVRGGRIGCPARCCDDQRAASVSDTPDGALWNCKHCGKGGSVLDLVMATRGCELAAAVEQLGGAPLPAPKLRVVKPPMNGGMLWERLSASDPAGETYLRGRGLEAAIPLVRFNVGRSGDHWLDGLAGRGFRVAVPLRDATGVVVDFQLRCVTPGVTGRDAKRSLCGERPRGTAFGRPDLAKGGGRVYVTEGMADTLALLSTGVVAVGAPGCDQLQSLARLIPERAEVVTCPQNDEKEQSQRAFSELTRALQTNRCTVRELSTPFEQYKDPADWLRDIGLDAFRRVISDLPPALPQPIVEVPNPSTGAAPGRFSLTDSGNAERLVAQHGSDLRYSRALGWLVWDRRRWAPDETDEVMRRAKATVRSIYTEAIAEQDGEVRKKLLSHAMKCESAARRHAMVDLAQAEPSMPVRPHDLDADAWALNCLNGTIDLRSGQLREHRRDDLITKLAPIPFDAAAQCPRWESFLADVQPDPEVRAFLQRFVGYSLTGVIKEHIFVVHYGAQGRNGKGVFTETLLGLLGDYARQVPTELLMAKSGDVHPTERTELMGRRLASASETEEGRSLNVGLVKALTGGDTISARRMHRDFFTFTPTHKLMLSTNHRPRIRETKNAIWARVKLVPWNAQFLDGDPRTNPNLKDELRSEWTGILAWAVRGCLEWQRGGLQPPAAVRAATDEYRSEEDPVGGFLEDRCVMEDGRWCTIRDLRAAYERWCEDQGEQYPLGGRVFNERLESRGLKREPKWTGVKTERCWLGVDVVSQPAQTGVPA